MPPARSEPAHTAPEAAGLQAADWNQALRSLAVAVPDDAPSIAVIDEVPWLVEQDGEFEGALQTVWDRHLSAKPVLLILVGSDMSVMEAFWLAFLQRGIPLIERGRGDLALEPLERSWTTWRGRAVEPVVRESLLRLLPDERWPQTEAVGGWWNRRNNPEIDLIGADRESVAGQVHFIGSVKWLESQPYGRREYEALVRDMLAVPGAEPGTALVAVFRSGVEAGLPLAAHWGPEDLVRAWQ